MIAQYTVIIERVVGEEEDHNDKRDAIIQLRDEIQSSFEQGFLSGNFKITDRKLINDVECVCI